MPRRLPETQVALLEAASATDQKTIDRLAEETGEKEETLTRAAFELADECLLAVTERTAQNLSLTDEA
jgi:phenylalanyl-tRNA synthetase alpha chain